MTEYKILHSITVAEEWKRGRQNQDSCRKPEEIILQAVKEAQLDGWELVSVVPDPNANMGLIGFLKRQY